MQVLDEVGYFHKPPRIIVRKEHGGSSLLVGIGSFVFSFAETFVRLSLVKSSSQCMRSYITSLVPSSYASPDSNAG
jgi:hypothetical protein